MHPVAFSELITMIRHLGGLTQSVVAREAGIAQPQLNAIENMKRKASQGMYNRILTSALNLALTIRLSEDETANPNNMTPERFSMLNRLNDLLVDEARAEEFILGNHPDNIGLKKEIAYLVWQSQVDAKRRRARTK